MAEIEEARNDLVFQIKLSLINLSEFTLADLGVEADLEKSDEWNGLIRSVGLDLIFLSQSISIKFIIQIITKSHQTISSKLEM